VQARSLLALPILSRRLIGKRSPEPVPTDSREKNRLIAETCPRPEENGIKGRWSVETAIASIKRGTTPPREYRQPRNMSRDFTIYNFFHTSAAYMITYAYVTVYSSLHSSASSPRIAIAVQHDSRLARKGRPARGTLATLAKHNDINSHPWIFLTSRNRSVSLSLSSSLSERASRCMNSPRIRDTDRREKTIEIASSIRMQPRTNPQAKVVNIYLPEFLLVFALM